MQERFGITDADIADAAHRAEVPEEAGQTEPVAALEELEIAIQLVHPGLRSSRGEALAQLSERADELGQRLVEGVPVEDGGRIHPPILIERRSPVLERARPAASRAHAALVTAGTTMRV